MKSRGTQAAFLKALRNLPAALIRGRWYVLSCTTVLVMLGFLSAQAPSETITSDPPTSDLVFRGNARLREIALTFDDGPVPEDIEPILRILKEEGVSATFFVVGDRVKEFPHLARQIIEEGHEIGNHSMSHPRLVTLANEGIVEELSECEDAILEATGIETLKLFRPPGLRCDDRVLRIAQKKGYITVHGDITANDYRGSSGGNIEELVTRKIRPGCIVLLHMIPETAEALPEIIRHAKESGYRFVTIPEMMSRMARPVTVEETRIRPTF